MRKLLLSLASMLMLCGCASSQISTAVKNTSTGKAKVESVNENGAVLKTNDKGQTESITINNHDHVVVIRKRKTISPDSLVPGENVEITYSNGNISAICVQDN